MKKKKRLTRKDLPPIVENGVGKSFKPVLEVDADGNTTIGYDTTGLKTEVVKVVAIDKETGMLMIQRYDAVVDIVGDPA
jgi:hypothetical protein